MKVKLEATGYQPFVVEFWVFSLSLCQVGLRSILVILLFFLLFDGASILSLRNCGTFGQNWLRTKKAGKLDLRTPIVDPLL